MQEKGLDFRFLLSRKIDPPLRSVAVREARAKRATTACCGGKIFFWGVFFAKTNPPHFENSAFFVEDLESPVSVCVFFSLCVFFCARARNFLGPDRALNTRKIVPTLNSDNSFYFELILLGGAE